MANRLIDRVVIIDSQGTLCIPEIPSNSTWLMKIKSVSLYSNDTTGEMILSSIATSDALIHIRNNQTQPFMLPQYLGGVNFKNLMVTKITAGTGYLYLE